MIIFQNIKLPGRGCLFGTLGVLALKRDILYQQTVTSYVFNNTYLVFLGNSLNGDQMRMTWHKSTLTKLTPVGDRFCNVYIVIEFQLSSLINLTSLRWSHVTCCSRYFINSEHIVYRDYLHLKLYQMLYSKHFDSSTHAS